MAATRERIAPSSASSRCPITSTIDQQWGRGFARSSASVNGATSATSFAGVDSMISKIRSSTEMTLLRVYGLRKTARHLRDTSSLMLDHCFCDRRSDSKKREFHTASSLQDKGQSLEAHRST